MLLSAPRLCRLSLPCAVCRCRGRQLVGPGSLYRFWQVTGGPANLPTTTYRVFVGRLTSRSISAHRGRWRVHGGHASAGHQTPRSTLISDYPSTERRQDQHLRWRLPGAHCHRHRRHRRHLQGVHAGLPEVRGGESGSESPPRQEGNLTRRRPAAAVGRPRAA